MIHFAYPNVVEDQKFWGCGRLVALLKEEVPEDQGYELVGEKYANDTAKVYEAVQLLAPEYRENKKKIYECKDQKKIYRGPSKNLAYLLALINGSRQIKLQGIHGDIWCTGDIITENYSFLSSIQLFDKKIEAFISDENPDNLFIAPEANARSLDEEWLEANSVQLVSLEQFKKLSPQELATGKTILKVYRNELNQLVSCLFQSPTAEISAASSERKKVSIFQKLLDAFQKLPDAIQKFIDTLEREEARTQRRQHNRQVMLERVKTDRVEPHLKKLLHQEIFLQLGKQEAPEAVPHPWDMTVQEMADREPRPIPKEKPVIEVFDELGRSLLILGAPGSGKTVTLLELARDAIARAETDPSRLIPVVLNLSSWAERKQPFAEWIEEELKLKHSIQKKITREWIENDDLLLLLDGLDEVEKNSRDACVDAINQFRQEHGVTEIVVCSRTEEYHSLSGKLHLRTAILLQPLTAQQIENYFVVLGPELDALRNAMRTDHVLQELTESPLMLSVMVLAYQGASLEEIQDTGTSEERRQRIFALYTEKIFKRRGVDTRYTPQQTIRWLSWLARRMMQHQQTEFFLEELQPTWLQTKKQRMLYDWSVKFFVLILWLAFFTTSINFGKIRTDYSNIDSINWLFDALLLWIFPAWCFLLSNILALKLPKVVNIIVVWIFTSLLFLADGYFFQDKLDASLLINLIVCFGGVGFITLPDLLLWGTLGIVLSDRNKIDIHPMLWNWKRGVRRFGLGIGIGIIFVTGFVGLLDLIFIVINPNTTSITMRTMWSIILFIIICWPICLILIIVLGLIKPEAIQEKSVPNQGIRRAGKIAVFWVIVSVGVSTIMINLYPMFLLNTFPNNFERGLGSLFLLSSGVAIPLEGLSEWLRFCVISGKNNLVRLGLPIGLSTGGGACIQHFTLHRILHSKGYLPWKLVSFLDYAAERIFLRKIGGGYIFVHRMLMEYFVSLENDKD